VEILYARRIRAAWLRHSRLERTPNKRESVNSISRRCDDGPRGLASPGLHHSRNITNRTVPRREYVVAKLTYVTNASADANNGDDDWRPGDPATPRSVVQFAAGFVQLPAIRHYPALAQDSYATSLSANHRSSPTNNPSVSSRVR